MKLDFWLLYIDSISSQIGKLPKNGAFPYSWALQPWKMIILYSNSLIYIFCFILLHYIKYILW